VRTTGGSRWSILKLASLSINAITGFSALPLQFITGLGLVLLVVFLGLGIQTMINWSSGHAADGFTTVILLLLLIGSSIMISLGLIGIYIARIFTEVKSRPRYIIAAITADASAGPAADSPPTAAKTDRTAGTGA